MEGKGFSLFILLAVYGVRHRSVLYFRFLLIVGNRVAAGLQLMVAHLLHELHTCREGLLGELLSMVPDGIGI